MKLKDEFIIGRKPIIDALRDGTQLEKVWLEATIRGEFEKELRFLCRQSNIPLIVAPKNKLTMLVRGGNNQGVVAQLSIVEYNALEQLIPFIYEQGEVPRIIMLDRVEDVRNLGAIARSAVWFGFNILLTSIKSSARINSVALKTSAGALTNIQVCRESSLLKAAELLKSSGITIYGSDTKGVDIKKRTEEGPFALIVGSEENGISRELLAVCDEVLRIPGTDKVESLNVSVSAAILMHSLYS